MLLAVALSFCACSNDDEPEPEPTPLPKPYFELDHAVSFLITKEAQSVEVPVKTNLNTPNVEISPNEANQWIKFVEIRNEGKDGKGGEKLTYSFSIKENTENRTRKGIIVFCNRSDNQPIVGENTVVFTQAGVE